MILTFLFGLILLSAIVIYRVHSIERHYAGRLESTEKLRLRQVGEALTKLKTAEERSNMLQGQLATIHNKHRDEIAKKDPRVTGLLDELVRRNIVSNHVAQVACDVLQVFTDEAASATESKHPRIEDRG